MAGHISVPVYPTLTADIVEYILEHSEAKLLFVGKLDPVWSEMKKGVPAAMRMVAFPLASRNDHEQWNDIIASYEPQNHYDLSVNCNFIILRIPIFL